MRTSHGLQEKVYLSWDGGEHPQDAFASPSCVPLPSLLLCWGAIVHFTSKCTKHPFTPVARAFVSSAAWKQVVTSMFLLSAGDSGHPNQSDNQWPSSLLCHHRHSHQTGKSSNLGRGRLPSCRDVLVLFGTYNGEKDECIFKYIQNIIKMGW